MKLAEDVAASSVLHSEKKKKEEKKSMPSLELHQPFVVVRYEAGVEGMFSRTVTDNGLFVLK